MQSRLYFDDTSEGERNTVVIGKLFVCRRTQMMTFMKLYIKQRIDLFFFHVLECIQMDICRLCDSRARLQTLIRYKTLYTMVLD